MRKTIGGDEGTLNFITNQDNDTQDSRFDLTELNDKCDIKMDLDAEIKIKPVKKIKLKKVNDTKLPNI